MSIYYASRWKKVHFDSFLMACTPTFIQILDGTALRVLMEGWKR